MSTDESQINESQQVVTDGETALLVPKDTVSTWPFDENDRNYYQVDTFMSNLYLGDGDNKPWLTNTRGRESETWMVQRIGNADLTPVPREPVATPRSPSWEWAEIWRALNTYQVLASRRADSPVANLIFQLQGGPNATAMFPQSLRDLLKANETTIINSKGDWVGRPTATSGIELAAGYTPYPGVQAAYGTGLQFFQKGGIGPMTMEAAFILASQFAGINWYKVGQRIRNNPGSIEQGIFWISAFLTPGNPAEYPIEEKRKSPLKNRNQGLRYYVRPAAPGNSVDAGMVLALDVDPDIDGWKNPAKNVFIFAVHAIDSHSRVFVPPNTQLTNLPYTRYNPITQQPPQCQQTTGTNIRFYGHAHAAVMKYQDWMNWIGQKHPGEPLPNYSQIGEQHFYFLSEDENNFWPRQRYLATRPA